MSITDPLLFVLGTVITAVTIIAMVMVGRSEAEDPAMNREEA